MGEGSIRYNTTIHKHALSTKSKTNNITRMRVQQRDEYEEA